MRFGLVPIQDACGAILAHSLPHLKLRKGRIIDARDIADLQAAGITQITVARLDPDDMDENRAATLLAQAIAPHPERAGLRITCAHTGRVNLSAVHAGVLRLNADLIHAANAIDPAITIATLPQWHRVAPGDLIATLKIIPYGVQTVSVERAMALFSADAIACEVLRPKVQTAALIETHHPNAPTNTKGRRSLAARLERLGVTLTEARDVAHDLQPLAQALDQCEADVVFLLTASATSDMRDTAPAAVVQAGGQIDHFGMPVDPGNLLFLAHHRGRRVIGLPGCARSPALNGADWVLERVCCGVDITPHDIMRMGVGGLLKEIPSRPRPREGNPKPDAANWEI